MRSSTAIQGRSKSRSLPFIAILLAVVFLAASCAGFLKPAPQPAPVTEAPAPAPAPEKPSLAALISAKNGAGIKEFFGNRELLDAPDSEGFYPLHRAVQDDATEIIELLLGLGAKPDPLDSKGRTPLRLALELERYSAAKILAAKGAAVFARDASGTSPAKIAVVKTGEAFDAVFNTATAKARDVDGTTPLHLAADALAEDAVRRLLEFGADASLKDDSGRLPIDMALLHPDRIESARIAERLCLAGPSPSFPEFSWFAQAARASNFSTIRFDDGNTPLHEAVLGKQRGFVEFLIEKKVAPNVRNGAGSAPLHEAMRSGWLEGAELLLKSGADANVRDGFDNTPLHIALPETGRELGIPLLLKYGADPGLKDRNGNLPLHVAIQVGYSAHIVEILLVAGSPPNAANAAGDAALHIAVRTGKLEYAPSLLSRGADIFLANGKGETPLSIALGAEVPAAPTASAAAPPEPPAIVKWDGGTALNGILTTANVNGRDNLGNTPIAIAVSLRAPAEAIALIVSKGGDPNVRNNSGDAPLHLAVRRNRRAQGEALLAARADIFASNAKGETPLILGLTASSGPVDWLFDSRTIAARDANGDGPLHHAARRDLPAALAFLAAKGADPKTRNVDGKSPLAVAVEADSAQATKALIEMGSPLSSRDAMGDTPLHAAVLWTARKCLPILLASGAETGARNFSGEAPLHQAVRKRDIDSMNALLAAGAKLSPRDNRGQTPLIAASRSGAIEAARRLLAAGADPEERDLAGRSALFAAVDVGDAEIVRVMVTAGASILARDGREESPLTLAATRNQALLDLLLTPDTINQPDADGRSPLRILVDTKPSPETIDLAIAKGALVDFRDRFSATALHAALRAGSFAVAGRIADAGADVFSTDRNGESPVSIAISLTGKAGQEALAAILGSKRVASADPSGNTALHYAALAGKTDAVSWILAAGADRTARNISGETAADLAEKRGLKDLATSLR